MIDFRSDTVTQPTEGMLAAMFKARVGDDVFNEDPTVLELEASLAAMFGKEAGIFCPSGTMTNQIAIKLHTQPGDEVICDALSHIYQYEGGGIAFNSGCSVQLIQGDRGRIKASEVLAAIHPDDVHKPISRLVSLENTSNRGGGSCYDFNEILRIKEVCLQHGLALHLDGARLFNALLAQQENPKQYGEVFDTISICLSKGLGCPVGSVLLGSKKDIHKARRIRKVLGGGMRQIGYLAAAGLYAIKHNINRLAEDHLHAQQIEAALKNKGFIEQILPVETNIIIADLKETALTAKEIAEELKSKGILVMPMGVRKLRFVLHLGIGQRMVEQTIEAIHSLD